AGIIANNTEQPDMYLSALTNEEALPDIIAPFLIAVARQRARGWQRSLRNSLADPRLQPSVIIACLTEDVGSQLRRQAISLCDWRLKNWIEITPVCLCLDVVKGLLQHHDSDVSRAAVVRLGVFRTEELVPELREDWELAVVRASADDHWISTFLSRNANLLERWVRAYADRVASEKWKWEAISDEVFPATRGLPLKTRLELLGYVAEHGAGRVAPELVAALAGDDEPSVRFVFSNPSLEKYAKALLLGEPDETWLNRAVLAMDAGMQPTVIAWSSMFGGITAFWGNESDQYDARLKAFQSLKGVRADPNVDAIIDAGLRVFSRERDRALGEKRRGAIYGE
ncbi:MAG: hypothetical protein ABIH46_10875, partial [Chloroflexota bacterium]